jgi:hypothetical protein
VFAVFAVSYMTLAAGLTLLMLQTGRVLFPQRPWRFLALAMICGAASFGLINNLLVLTIPGFSGYSLIGAIAGAFLFAQLIFERLVRGESAQWRWTSLATN